MRKFKILNEGGLVQIQIGEIFRNGKIFGDEIPDVYEQTYF